MAEEHCPRDEVPMIRRDALEEKSTYLPEGTILGGRYKIIRLIGVEVWVRFISALRLILTVE